MPAVHHQQQPEVYVYTCRSIDLIVIQPFRCFSSSILFQHNKKAMIHQKMPKKFYKVKRITGENGAFVEDAIACTSGRIRPHLNCQTVQMDGSDLYWMANWLLCIQAVAQKTEVTVQVKYFCAVRKSIILVLRSFCYFGIWVKRKHQL